MLQVHLVEFHPVQPWIGLADKSSNVAVWDYRSSQVCWIVCAMGTAVYNKQQAWEGAGKPGTSRVWSTWGLDQAFSTENDIIPRTSACKQCLMQTVPYTCACTQPGVQMPLRLLPAVCILDPPFCIAQTDPAYSISNQYCD